MTFLNADEIAKGLPTYPSLGADREASRVLLNQVEELSASKSDFAVETTLASRSLASRGRALQKLGYQFQLLFAFLPDPDLAVIRVAGRVRQGGHNIPEETIRRRYYAGLANFFELYLPLVDSWKVFDSSIQSPITIIAEGGLDRPSQVERPDLWNLMQESAKHG